MSIRVKIVLIVVPLLIGALIIGAAASLFTARTAVTRVTVELLDFKTAELEKHVDKQWRLLVENDLTSREEMVQAAQAGIEVFARSIIRNDDTELIIAVDDVATVVMETTPNVRELVELSDPEKQILIERATLGSRELLQTPIGGIERMAMGFRFEPFAWYFLVTQDRDAFFSDIDQIQRQTLLLVVIGSVLSILLLFGFVRVLTGPLTRVVGAMRNIISTSDLSGRVPVDYRDEIGEMSQTFNVMVGELERLTDRIKGYAYEAVLAQKREAKVRNIFQKYVPQELIDRFFQNPDSMLVGENRNLSILFSDIRSFTSISEGIPPNELVESLNEYFSVMVDIIMNRDGMIDKYIGDAIMAVFGRTTIQPGFQLDHRNLTRGFWDDLIATIRTSYTAVADILEVQVTGLPGTVVQGLRADPLEIGPSGSLVLNLPNPATYEVRSEADLMYAIDESFYLGYQPLQIDLDQSRAALFAGGHLLQQPSVPRIAVLVFLYTGGVLPARRAHDLRHRALPGRQHAIGVREQPADQHQPEHGHLPVATGGRSALLRGGRPVPAAGSLDRPRCGRSARGDLRRGGGRPVRAGACRGSGVLAVAGVQVLLRVRTAVVLHRGRRGVSAAHLSYRAVPRRGGTGLVVPPVRGARLPQHRGRLPHLLVAASHLPADQPRMPR